MKRKKNYTQINLKKLKVSQIISTKQNNKEKNKSQFNLIKNILKQRTKTTK